MASIAEKLRGTGVALVTPFTEKGKIDFPSLEKITGHIVKNKCEYIVVLGTTGESVTLTAEEKKQVMDTVVKKVNGKIPLVLGVGGNNTLELASYLNHTDLRAFSAILSVSPYYNKPTQQGIYLHYQALSKASPLPILLYNVPGRTSSNITAETTLKLARDFKNIIGIKEASGNVEQCMTIINGRPSGFLVISGDDSITLPLVASGADGVISVVANALPLKFSEMVRQALKGDFSKARKLHYAIYPLIPLLFAEGNPGGIKAALSILGLCKDSLRLPLAPVSRQLHKSIGLALNRI